MPDVVLMSENSQKPVKKKAESLIQPFFSQRTNSFIHLRHHHPYSSIPVLQHESPEQHS
jgi:hypothetical protein